MAPRKKPAVNRRFSLRLAAEEAAEADRIVDQKGFRSRNELFLWLLRGYLKRQDDLEEQTFAIIDA